MRVIPLVAVVCLLPTVAIVTADRKPRCPSDGDAAAQRLIVATCRDLKTALGKVPGASVRSSSRSFLDERFDCNRHGCVVALKGSFEALRDGPSPDTWLGEYLEQKGWHRTESHGADGPDGTVYALHRPGAICIVEGRWNHWDDEEGGHTDDTYQVSVSCGGAERTPPREGAGAASGRVWNYEAQTCDAAPNCPISIPTSCGVVHSVTSASSSDRSSSEDHGVQ